MLFDLFQVGVDGIVVALATLFITRPLVFRQIAASDVDVVQGFADRDGGPSGQTGHDVEGTGAFLEHELVPLLLCVVTGVWSLTQFYSVDFSSIKDRCKVVRFQQTHNQGLRQLLLTVSWDLRA